jgi:hypothetical protein
MHRLSVSDSCRAETAQHAVDEPEQGRRLRFGLRLEDLAKSQNPLCDRHGGDVRRMPTRAPHLRQPRADRLSFDRGLYARGFPTRGFENAPMTTWNVLHVLAMFVAFALTTGVGIFMIGLADTGDVKVIRAAARIARSLQRAGGIVLLIGVVFGFATAGAMVFNLTSRWLVEAYALVVLLFIIGGGVHQSWLGRLAKAAEASPIDHASPELVAIAGDRMVRIAGPVSGLVWIALIVVMIVRPS